MDKSIGSEDMVSSKHVVSPIATGGGGFNFERHVGAYYLALLLLRAVPYGQRAGQVGEVRFQRLYAGEPLDDLIVVSASGVGEQKLALQIKRDLVFSEDNSIFEEVLHACWQTFASAQFIRSTDHFGMVIARYSKKVDEYYQRTLEWARNSANAADFFSRIAQPKLAHQDQRNFVALIRSKLESYAGGAVTDEALWDFLRALVILHLDVHRHQSKDYTYIVEMLSRVLPDERKAETPALFTRLSEYAGELAEAAGSVDLATLIERLHADGIPVLLSSPGEQEGLATRATISEMSVKSSAATPQQVIEQQSSGRIGAPDSIFQTPAQFFQKYLDPTRVVNHTFPLMGRRTHVEYLRNVPSVTQRVFLLSGAGGMGKSKILQAGLAEMASAHPDVTICFLSEGSEYTPEHASELPTGKVVLVIDDAHRLIKGLGGLFALAQQYPDRLKLVLSTRLHGLLRLKQELTFAGFDSQQILELPPVRPLTDKDVEALATEIMGAEAGPRLAQLVSMSRDAPLITVIAGQLFVRNKLDPALLTSDDSGAFQQDVLARFQEELVGQVARELDSERARKILRLVAALSPLDPQHAQLMERAASFLKLEPDEFLSALMVLERSGVLLRQADRLRITPDVLSDYVLAEACFMGQSQLTGYGKRIVDAFRDLDLRTVLQNMAELDWRVSRGKGTGLLQEVWRDLRQSYETATYQGRLSLLGLVAPVAYFQPDEALDFARLALRPSPPTTIEASDEPAITEEYIHQALAPILRDIGYYPAHVREAATLLWQIGRDDDRPLDKTTTHSVRILHDLAAYMRHSPVGYYELLFDWLEELAQIEDAFHHRHSPLDILPALLRREGTEEWTQGYTLFISSFLVDPTTTAALRRRVLNLMHTLGQRDEIPLRRTVVKALVNVLLRGIIGLGNFHPTADHIAAWQGEDRIILGILEDLLANEGNPVVLVDVEGDLLSVAADPKHAAIAADVTRLINQLPLTLESTLIRYLRQGRIQRRLLLEHRGSSVDGETLEAALEPELTETIDAFFSTYSTPEEMKRELERLFAFLTDASAEASESFFLLERLCRRAPDAMLDMCELLVVDPGSEALKCLPALLAQLHEYDGARVLACFRAGETSDSLALKQTMAWAVGIPRTPASEDEQQIILRFVLDEDRATALAGIRALSRFPSERYTNVFATLDQIVVGDDAKLAWQICQLFDAQWGIDPACLPPSFVSSMLEKLVPLGDWSQVSSIRDFIEWVTVSAPEQAAAYYLARIAYQYEIPPGQHKGYSAVPAFIIGGGAERKGDVKDDAARARALRSVRDYTLHVAGPSDLRQLTEVFVRLSQYYAGPALDVLLEWIDSGEPQKVVTAARLLKSTGPNFVFAQEPFVVHLLERAQMLGAETFQQVQGTLVASAQSGLGAGWVRAPDPKDETLRDRAAEVAQRYPQGHVAYAFYQSLHQIALDNIQRKMHWTQVPEEG